MEPHDFGEMLLVEISSKKFEFSGISILEKDGDHHTLPINGVKIQLSGVKIEIAFLLHSKDVTIACCGELCKNAKQALLSWIILRNNMVVRTGSCISELRETENRIAFLLDLKDSNPVRVPE